MMRNIKSRSISSGAMAVVMGLTVAVAVFAPGTTKAQYPDRPIHYVIPFPPGGSTDFTGRVLGKGISDILKQPVVIENRAGAGGNVGAGYVARSAPDGYTLFQGTIGTHAINPTLYKNLSYDALKDFVPIARMTAGTNVLVVHPDVPANTVEELIAYAKANPGKLNMGSSGAGSSIHLSGELFQLMTGTKFTHVPYRGGGPALNDLLAGHIQLMFDNLNVSVPHIDAGRLRALGVTTPTRSPRLPNVPTLDEAGVKGYDVTSWSGVFAPAGTSPETVQILNKTINEALSSTDIRRRYEEAGVQIDLMSVSDFDAFVRKEIKRWGDIVRQANITVE